jgi:hypothetical protein
MESGDTVLLAVKWSLGSLLSNGKQNPMKGLI